MAKKADNRWYPQREHFDTHEAWDAHIQTLKQVYKMQDQLANHVEQLKKITSNIGQMQQQSPPGGALNTVIGGFALRPSNPTNGQRLTFNATTQQIEWQ